GLHEGRRLMADPDTPSYAAELEVLSKDEVRINGSLMWSTYLGNNF
ncbi:unnamed protein product, partial [Rotaria magnacalcarata]